MADILLINPSVNPASQNKIVNAIIANVLPTSLGTLTSFLNSAGIDSVRIIDEQLDFITDTKLEEVIASLKNPKIIGISALTMNSKRAYELADKINSIDQDVFVIFGGIHPTVLPEEALEHHRVDVVVRGEGEKTLVELVRCIAQEKDYTGIEGISFKHDNSIIHNPDRPMIIDLDEIPPFPYHLFEKDMERYHSFAALFTSRGCPYNCTFCSSRNISGRRYRYFTVERIISDIKLLANKYLQKTIWLMDDNLAANEKHFCELLDRIIKNGLHQKAKFHGSMRGDNLTDEVLEKAKLANFKMLSFGLETTSEPLMKVIQKGETVKQVEEAIIKTDRIGIAAAATLIFGLPTETRKDRWDAIKRVRRLPLSSVRFNTLTPYPGTAVYNELSRSGKIYVKKDWENFAVQYMWEGDELPYIPDGNNRYELMFDTMYANFSFYLSFNGIKRMLKSSFAGGNVIRLKENWFFSPKTIWRLTRLFFYLANRFLWVAIKMILKK